MYYNTDLCHDILFRQSQPRLSQRKPGQSYEDWKEEIKEKFIELTGVNKIAQNACPLNIQVEWKEQKEGYALIRFTFDSEIGATVPCYLLIPKAGKKKYPVAIVLQGHSTGFHNSIGEKKYEEDLKYQENDRGAFALQAVRNGYIALAIEQRGMGECRSPRSYGEDNTYYPRPHMCAHVSLTAIALGRTVLAERIWDVRKAIDALSRFPECDLEKIMITGNSGGGTASYYAACYDERIKISVPSCSFCSYKASIFDIEHCACNYIPNVAGWFEMEDLSCLIAPRDLMIVTGQKDAIFPIQGVRKSYEKVRQIYNETGAGENCKILETPMGHWWCEDIVWNAINEKCKKLGWR